jgi:hypothetical protein
VTVHAVCCCVVRSYDAATGFLRPSTYTLNGKQHDNMTLINLALRVFGPMREESLTLLLLGFQTLCCATALSMRYHLGSYLYGSL